MSAPRALRIGDLAAAAGVARSLIRYYETCGLLPAPPRAGGVRQYGAGALGRLQHVLVVRRLGLSIDETRTALACLPRALAPCRRIRRHRDSALRARPAKVGA
jgi:DNA-binding transcriptional MerR regulator